MSNDEHTQTTTVTHPDKMTKEQKHNFRQRIIQFLTKVFRHLTYQPTPNCLSNKPKHSKTSKKKNDSKFAAMNRYYIRSQYPAQYRTCSMRERTCTLSSIKEE